MLDATPYQIYRENAEKFCKIEKVSVKEDMC